MVWLRIEFMCLSSPLMADLKFIKGVRWSKESRSHLRKDVRF